MAKTKKPNFPKVEPSTIEAALLKQNARLFAQDRRSKGILYMIKFQRIASHRFNFENSARDQNRGINEVFHYPGGLMGEQALKPGVEAIGFTEAHAAGFEDPMFYEGMPERRYLILVCIDGEECWFHTNPTASIHLDGIEQPA